MSSTNKTTNYELSQFISSDKPTFLGDYNGDMGKIDTGIYNAKDQADTNATNIGTLTNLTTESKSNLVGAINEVDGHADTNAGNISTNTTNIATNTANIGVMANLKTQDKDTLVKAVNNIFDYLNLSDIHDLVNPVVLNSSNQVMTGATVEANKIKVALNSAGTYGKIYGSIRISGITGYPRVKFINTGIQGITESFEFEGGIIYGSNVLGIVVQIDPPAQGETSASVLLRFGGYTSTTTGTLFPCIYYFKSFGDVA